jgi:2-polyprenyl-6-methoxyphenol hydroxylase-like FAD-dependent oxidoreductase
MNNVLISGAGVAGPALAYWLERRGWSCTIVERARELRVGGQAVDFRGPIHRAVLERMNLWDPIHAHRTRPGELVMLRASGEPAAALPAVMMAGDVEILRGDLCRLLVDRTERTEYRFGDHVTALEDRGDDVRVTFASGESRAFDVVVGADGLHSGVRALAFGDESRWLAHHGYRIASFALPKSFHDVRGGLLYSRPGRAMCVSGFGETARALLVHVGGELGAERRDVDAQKRQLRETFDGMGWHSASVLDALDEANDLYVDAIASVHVDRYARGRVVLLGDAAWGGTLGGQGTSLAIVGAYVLAGELAKDDDVRAAFARFETRMRPYATRCQNGAKRVGEFFAPRTRIGLALRNFMYWVFTTRPMLGFFERLVKDAATDFALPEYA